jgi:MtaA/CmuA family methyltransferase
LSPSDYASLPFDSQTGHNTVAKSVCGSKRLVAGTLAGSPAAKPLVGPLAVHYCAGLSKVSLRDYTLDPRRLAESVVRYYERFRPDAVWLSADTWVTAEAMGAEVAFPGPTQPLAGTGRACVQSAADIERISPPDPGTQGRWPLMLEAMRLIDAAIGKDVFIVACFDQYPFSLACALMGIQQVMLLLIDNPSVIESLMEKCSEYTVAYATALAEAGADMLSGGDSPAGLIGPRLYRDVALPFEEQVFAALKSKFSIPLSLHICGNAMPILADMATSGADVLELDQHVDIAYACRVVGPEIAIWGNLDPVGLLARGTPEQVRAATTTLLDTVAACGQRRFVLSSGCTLAVDTPPENLDALLETARCRGPLDPPPSERRGE